MEIKELFEKVRELHNPDANFFHSVEFSAENESLSRKEVKQLLGGIFEGLHIAKAVDDETYNKVYYLLEEFEPKNHRHGKRITGLQTSEVPFVHYYLLKCFRQGFTDNKFVIKPTEFIEHYSIESDDPVKYVENNLQRLTRKRYNLYLGEITSVNNWAKKYEFDEQNKQFIVWFSDDIPNYLLQLFVNDEEIEDDF